MSRAALFLLIAMAACSDRPSRTAASTLAMARDFTDSAFAVIQTRGHTAMGVNQYTSSHRFESLPDGGRITLERDIKDSAGAAQIQSHMQTIALAFRQGNFALPGFVHDREVPGTAVMAERRSRISYTVDVLPRGGQLRIHTDDSAAVAAIHQFLAFQRQDHRSAADENAH
jgi:hypothetical protein